MEVESLSDHMLQQSFDELDRTTHCCTERLQMSVGHLMTYLEDHEDTKQCEALLPGALNLELWIPLLGTPEKPALCQRRKISWRTLDLRTTIYCPILHSQICVMLTILITGSPTIMVGLEGITFAA